MMEIVVYIAVIARSSALLRGNPFPLRPKGDTFSPTNYNLPSDCEVGKISKTGLNNRRFFLSLPALPYYTIRVESIEVCRVPFFPRFFGCGVVC